MKRRIIVLIDFSPFSKDQLKLAHNWGRAMKAELFLVHVPLIVKPVMTDPDTEKVIAAQERDDALVRLKKFTQTTLEPLQNINYLVSTENLMLLLPKIIAEGFDDLIFVGIKGTGILKKIFWGSTTVDIIDHVNHSVVAVPKNPQNLFPEKLYIAIHKDFLLNLQPFENILSLFGDVVKQIVFISVIKDKTDLPGAEKYLNTLVEKYKPKKVVVSKVFEGKDAFQEVKKLMLDKKDGLLVVQRGIRSLLDQVYRKFFINELVYDGSIPLIV